jgi:RNA polymerase sigma-70 factor (ECF subfamily)
VNTKTADEMNETALTLDQELLLVRRVRVDTQAFDALYDHYFPRIYNYVYFRVQERAPADDLVSAIFVRALDRLDTFDERRGSFGVWLFGIAHHALVDYYRSVKRSVNLPLERAEQVAASSPSIEQGLAQKEQQAAILRQVARLSDREQEIIGLKFGAGLTNRKIATLMGLGENHVAVILYRAMRRLRRELDEGSTE